MMFRFTFPIVSGLVTLGCAVLPASAQQFSRDADQQNARQAMVDGRVMPFSIIKRRVQSEMGDATYVGVASPREGIYRLQFIQQDGKVVWVDVDGKTGNIIARTR